MTPGFVVSSEHPALPGHFPGHPVVPGVLLLDHVAEAARAAFGLGAPRSLPRVKFTAPLRPGQAVAVVLERRGADRVAFTLRVAEHAVAAGEMAFAP